jgi:hypothetical protein
LVVLLGSLFLSLRVYDRFQLKKYTLYCKLTSHSIAAAHLDKR